MEENNIVKELREKLNYDEETCVKIDNIANDIFLIGRKNKEKMIMRFIDELNVSEADANKIYETLISIIGTRITKKFKKN